LLLFRYGTRGHITKPPATRAVEQMRRVIGGLLISLFIITPTLAAGADGEKGRETNLPIPRYVSIKASEANVRRGPGLTHRIDWVFQRRHLPVQVTAEFGHWRRIQDIEGAGGWVHYSLLSGARYVLVTKDFAALYKKPSPEARLIARAEAGVVARLGDCIDGWCKVSADRLSGWARREDLWGIAAGEVLD